MNLWNTETEKQFFIDALNHFSTPEKLFYGLRSGHYAYIPNELNGEGKTLQSRNSLIGHFTETWVKRLFDPIAKRHGLFAINTVECSEIGLNKKSEADLAFCTTNTNIQQAKNIKLIFEIKMSIVSNYKFTEPNVVEYIGDYTTHKGNPSLLRSDSMLKAIGKAINIKVSNNESAQIPVIILGNSPITKGYSHKVDALKIAGVIQSFWSLNPTPTTNEFISETEKHGFRTIENISVLESLIGEILRANANFFSSMISNQKLGEYIRIAHQEPTDEARAQKFLSLIRGL